MHQLSVALSALLWLQWPVKCWARSVKETVDVLLDRPTYVYLSTRKDPVQVEADGGLHPCNSAMKVTPGQPNPYSLFNHAFGPLFGKDYVCSVYSSTSETLEYAKSSAGDNDDWIYEIKATDTIFELGSSLWWNPLLSIYAPQKAPPGWKIWKHIYVAFGTIPLDQIKGWYKLSKGQTSSKHGWIYAGNHVYNETRYGKMNANQKQLQLTGYPRQATMWKTWPWGLIDKQQTLEEYGIRFKKEKGKDMEFHDWLCPLFDTGCGGNPHKYKPKPPGEEAVESDLYGDGDIWKQVKNDASYKMW